MAFIDELVNKHRQGTDLDLVFSKEAKLFTDSRDVARVFKKEHYNVIKAIRNLDCSEKFTAVNFNVSDYIDNSGKSNTMYNITRDGLTFLVMGFTGKEAARWKERYIMAFNMMEERLRNPVGHLTSVDAARYWVKAEERCEVLEGENAELKTKMAEDEPKLEVYDRWLDGDNLCSLEGAAAYLDVRPIKFTEWLRETGYLKKRKNVNIPARKSVGKDLFNVVSGSSRGRFFTQTKVTSKGLDYFMKIVPDHLTPGKAS